MNVKRGEDGSKGSGGWKSRRIKLPSGRVVVWPKELRPTRLEMKALMDLDKLDAGQVAGLLGKPRKQASGSDRTSEKADPNQPRPAPKPDIDPVVGGLLREVATRLMVGTTGTGSRCQCPCCPQNKE